MPAARRKLFMFAGVLALCVCEHAVASVIGTFNIAGTITLTQNTITWTSNVSPFPPDQATIGPGATGVYNALGGTTVAIIDLNHATEPVGSLFAAQPFISFNANPGLSPLLINFIFAGIYSPAGCAAAPAVGQTCTPSAASPFSFLNTPPPGAIGSSVTAVFEGVSADGLDTWDGIFTSQFSVPFQTILAAFAPGGSGSITNTYSATITVSAPSSSGPSSSGPSLPEPGTLSLLSLGFAGIAFLRRRKLR